MSAAAARRELGADAVVSVNTTAEWLPWRESAARSWLEKEGLIVSVPGQSPVVVWGDVLERLRQLRGTADKPATSTGRRRLRRGGL